MPAIILIKRADSDGKPSSLSRGELAYAFGAGTVSNDGQRLFIGDSTNIKTIGGEYFTQFLDHTPGTLTASSAIITDASNKIDQLKVDVLTLDSNVISTSSDNLVLNPSTGIVSIGNLEFESNEIRTTSANETLIINPYPSADSGTVIIKGNLRVDGTTTTVNSTEVTINDLAIVLGDSAGTDKVEFDGAGIIVFDADANAVFGATSPSITYDGTNDRWNFSRAIDVDSAYIDNVVFSQANITTLDVSDSATIVDLNVTGNTNLATLDISDSATIVDLNVTGNTNLATLDVSDSATIVDLNVTGQTTLATLDVSDSATIVDLNVTGQTTLTNANITTLSIDSAVISGITFTDSALSQFLDSDDFVFSNGQASLKNESIQDVVGAMVSANTETNITVTYQDADGTIDFEVPIASVDSVGVAQFDSNEFNVVAGLVTIDTIDGGSF
jgi:hypothetical protein